ncbi:MAG TPA: hypothetical protein VKY92_27405 [Verrucomicrobiae bacterium]|nr:hypothetical protein [Verrucomicrobiae bacterium]
MIGALAVVAILASLLVPVVVRQIDQAAWTQEVTNLGAISNAIVLQTLRTKTLHVQTAWPSDAAVWAAMSPNSIATNFRGIGRAFLFDPNCSLTLPFAQNAAGASVTNARILIVSTIAKALPVSTSSGVSASDFNNIWVAPDRTRPAGGTWSAWAGRGEDLVIQRINLQQLFHHVILFNRDGTNVAAPGYTVDTSPGTVANQWDSFFLDGSILGLTNGTLVSSEVINKDMSRVYELGTWNSDIGPGPMSTSEQSFTNTAYNFLRSSYQTNNVASPVQVAQALQTYMNAYSSWAQTCFSYDGAQGPDNVIAYQMLTSSVSCFCPVGHHRGPGLSGLDCTIVP